MSAQQGEFASCRRHSGSRACAPTRVCRKRSRRGGATTTPPKSHSSVRSEIAFPPSFSGPLRDYLARFPQAGRVLPCNKPTDRAAMRRVRYRQQLWDSPARFVRAFPFANESHRRTTTDARLADIPLGLPRELALPFTAT